MNTQSPSQFKKQDIIKLFGSTTKNNTHSSSLSNSVLSTIRIPTVIYKNNEEALKGDSVFTNHTYDAHFRYNTSKYDNDNDIRYFPWNDSLNYTRICNNVLNRITNNDTFYIISGSLIGGLGHKYLSVFYSVTYAILLGRRFLSMCRIDGDK